MEYERTDTTPISNPSMTGKVYRQRRVRATGVLLDWELIETRSSAGSQWSSDFARSMYVKGVRDPTYITSLGERFVGRPYTREGTDGVVTPGSLEVISRTWFPNTPDQYHNSRYKVQISGGLIRTALWAPPTLLSVSTSNQHNILKAEAASKAKTTALQTLVSVMEGPKTFWLLANRVANLANVIQAARGLLRGDPREYNRLKERIDVHGLDQGLSLWLEWRYGWRILLYEIDAILQYTTGLLDRPTEVLLRSRARDEQPGVTSVITGGSVMGSSAWNGTSQLGSVSIQHRVTIQDTLVRTQDIAYYKLDKAFAQSNSLGLHAYPTLLELLPYSFVVEWFVNIGDWLGAYATHVPGLTWEGGCSSTLIRNRRTVEVTGGTLHTTETSNVSGGKVVVDRYRFNRSFYDPGEPVALGTYNGLNLKRAMDLVALLGTRFGGLSRDVTQWRFKTSLKG